MHPAEEIFCEKSSKLRGKTVVIGITGSIAATECFSTVRELIRHGAKVIVAMSEAATKMVAPQTMEFASGNLVITELTGKAEHVFLFGEGSEADALVIYPATANTISKIANGIDDGTVTSMATVAIGHGLPVAVAPAMHDAMYRNPGVAKNVLTLREWGVSMIGPNTDGPRAKVASREEVIAWVTRMLSKDDLVGKRILVIGGRSEEPIDSMRIITNRSTGLMSVRIAERAFERGAEVELWMGGCSVPLPDYIDTKRFAKVSELVSMVKGIDHDAVIVPAALADFSPGEEYAGKMPSDKGFSMKLVPVPKVLPLIREKCDTVIGFKAESGLTKKALTARARERLEAYDLTAVVANDIDSAGKTSASVILVSAKGEKDITGTKESIANSILDICS